MTEFTNDFSKEVWSSTYKYYNENHIDDTFRRVAKALSSVEKKEQQKFWEDQFYDILTDFKITLGGRIYANAGTTYKGTTLINCFVGPRDGEDLDSLDGILKTLREQVHTLRSEGGWGMNFSFMRPRGAYVYGIGVESPGAVKYIDVFDVMSEIITAGSGKKGKQKEAKEKIRKGAMMGILDVWHPDIEEFIAAKLTPGRFTKFNISVNCSNEFMEQLIDILDLIELIPIKEEESISQGNNDIIKDHYKEIEKLDKWDLIFPDTTFKHYKKEWDGNIRKWKNKNYPIIVYKTVKLTQLWESIIQSTYTRNDPGVFFGDRANETHCWNYGAYIGATNPCGEQALPYGSTCNLLSINLTQFLKRDNTGFDLNKLKKYIPIAVRLADNVNDYSNAPLPQYIESLRNRRRIGLGIIGWGSALYLLNIRFGSQKAEQIKAELMKCITHTAVESSISLAIEKGAFKDCDFEKHSQQKFWKQIELPNKLIKNISKYGIRNSALFSIQPTGNTSVLANILSGGLEPIFLPEYTRTVILSTCPDFLKDKVPNYLEGEFKETDYFKLQKEGDDEILVYKHENIVYKIDKNRGLTKEVLCEDYAVKKLKEAGTWNPNADWAVTTTSLTVDDHITDLKGFGKWIDSAMSKTINLPNDYPYDDFKKIYLNAFKSGVLKGVTTYRAGTTMSVLSEVKKDGIKYNDAPRRPKELQCQVHLINKSGKQYFVLVGLLDGQVYEVFAGQNKDVIDKKTKQGKIIKRARGKYRAEFDDGSELSPLSAFISEDEESITRLISTSLRHGTRIEFLVSQLSKSRGDMNSFEKVIGRVLKEYIKDGTNISGEDCPDCGTNLIFAEGCKSCKNCGYSKC